MKKIFLLGFFIVFVTQNLISQELVLLDGNKRKWVAGQKKSGYGFDYKFRFQAAKNIKQFQFKGAWIDSLFYEGIVFKDNKVVTTPINLIKNEELLIKVTIRYIPDEKDKYQLNNIKPFEKMPDLKDKKYETLMFYTTKGKKRYHIVYELETLTPMYMP